MPVGGGGAASEAGYIRRRIGRSGTSQSGAFVAWPIRACGRGKTQSAIRIVRNPVSDEKLREADPITIVLISKQQQIRRYWQGLLNKSIMYKGKQKERERFGGKASNNYEEDS